MRMPAGARAGVILMGGLLVVAATSAAMGQMPLAADRPIEYFIGDGDPKHGYQSSDRELAEWALESWAKQATGGFTVRRTGERDAVVRVYWPAPTEQLFGEMRRLMVNGRRGAAVYVGTDMPALGPDLAARARQDPLWRDAIVYLTCVHEIGHALGLPHTRDFRDIMYFFGYGGDIVEYFARYRRRLESRSDLRLVSPLSSADLHQLRALYPAR